jgi:hypothetical protein
MQTESETWSRKPIEWDSMKTAPCWRFLIQRVMAYNGSQVVHYLGCAHFYTHSGLYTLTTITNHLLVVVYIKRGKELVNGWEGEDKQPIEKKTLFYLNGIETGG